MTETELNGLVYTLKQAVYITENILRAHEEDGFNELVPKWNKALHDSLNTFLYYKNSGSNIDYIGDYIDYCEYLFRVMTPLE